MPGWPKDTNPNVISRARELATLTPPQVLASLKAQQLELNERLMRDRYNGLQQRIAGDPALSAMLVIVSAAPDNADMLLIFRMCVYLDHEADFVVQLLQRRTTPDQEMLANQFEQVASTLFARRQIIDVGLRVYYARNPDILRDYLKQGLHDLLAKWAGAANDLERRKLLRDVLDSPKGYPKTIRSIADWVPPAAVNITQRLNVWLDSFNNTSPFTGISVSKTAMTRDQLASYATAKEPHKRYVWFSVFNEIRAALGLSEKAAIGGAVLARAAEIHAALDALVTAGEVTRRIGEFDAIWSEVMG